MRQHSDGVTETDLGFVRRDDPCGLWPNHRDGHHGGVRCRSDDGGVRCGHHGGWCIG